MGVATLPNPFRPSSPNSRRVAFVLWNVLCMWLGVVDLLIILLLKTEIRSVWALLIALVDGLLGYIFAYSFYFVFISYGKRKWMQRGLAMIVGYVIGTAYLTYQGAYGSGAHIERVETVLNGMKATAYAVLVRHGLQIYLG